MKSAICSSVRATAAMRAAVRLVLTVLALSALAPVQATVRCVGSVNGADGLIPAFTDANNGDEGSTWDIRVRSGTYQLSSTLIFQPDGNHDNKIFYLSGGWDATCSNQTGLPAGTILRGIASTANSTGTNFDFLGDNNRYDIESIRFENFSTFLIDDKSCGPYQICPGTEAIVVDHAEFDNGEFLEVVAYDAQRVLFTNNLVTHMAPYSADGSSRAFAPVDIDVKPNANPTRVMSNTFASINCLTTPGGVMIHASSSSFMLNHNIFQTTGCSSDVYIDSTDGGQPVAPYSNLFLDIGGSYSGNLADQGNVIDFNPKFVDAANGNYRLQNASPAVNAGQTLLGAVQLGMFLSPIDLDRQLRPIGTRFDIGAYESLVNDGAPPTIKVTNTSDDPMDTGSLRHAIDQANSQIGTPQRIVFDIPGACPQLIYLDSALPDVTESLFVDGYSQPGAAPNDLELGSDATICIVLAPATSGITHALQVASGQPASTQLIVDGLAFATSLFTFTGAAIELRGGSGHVVSGSVFGGTGPGDIGSLGNLERGVLIRGTATGVTVGGSENRARNYFGGLNNNAIVITDSTTSGHTIQNNYIGVTPNGLSAQANSLDGISATGGTNVMIVDNTIDASRYGIYISGASTQGFVIERNRIGINAAGYGFAQHANDVGIEITGGTGQHTIGYPATGNVPVGTFSNDIRNNNGAGVELTPSAGAYNSIRGNRFEANGRNGTGLGIALGATAQLANDAGDGDSGPNLAQNYPIISNSAPNGATRAVKAVLNTNTNQSLRVDFYRSPTCPDAATGPNATSYIGSADVNSGPTGIVNFTAQVAVAGAPGYLTATATTSVGNTSELAPCFSEDTIFRNGHEAPGL